MAAEKRKGILYKTTTLLFYFVAYLAASLFAHKYLVIHDITTVFWFPAGITMGMVILHGYVALIPLFLAELSVDIFLGFPLSRSVVFAASSVFHAWTCLALLRIWPIDKTLEKARDYFRVVLLAGFVASILPSLIGTFVFVGNISNPASFFATAFEWWISTSVAIVVITPLILIWRTRKKHQYTTRRLLEAALITLCVVVAGQYILGGPMESLTNEHAKGFVLFIFISWAAVRLGRRLTSILIVICTVQILTTVSMNRELLMTENPFIFTVSIWLYIVTLSITGMALAIYVYQSKESLDALSDTSAQLELTSALAKVGGWEIDIESQRVHFSKEAKRLLEIPDDALPTVDEALAFLDDEERLAQSARIQLAMEQDAEWDVEFAMTTAQGKRIWVRTQGAPHREDGKVKKLIGTLQDLTLKHEFEEALKKSDQRLRTIFRTLAEGVSLNEMILDEKGDMIDFRILEVNDAYYSVADYALSKEVIGALASELYRLPREVLVQLGKQIQTTKETLHHEHFSPDTKKYYLISTSPATNNQFVTSFFDLTAIKETQKKLAESEMEFKRIIETAAEGIWVTDLAGKTTFANERMARMLGYSVQEMVGKQSTDFIPEELHPQVVIKLQQYATGLSETVESVLLHKDGHKIATLTSVSPVSNPQGAIIGALGMLTDISERKRIENELLQSEARYRHLIESSIDAIVVHQDDRIVFANDAAPKLVRAGSIDELIGRNILDFVAPEFRALALERVRTMAQSGGRVQPAEERLLCFDGTSIDVEISATATVFNNRPAVMVSVRDITDRKRSDAQIRFLGHHDVLTGLPNRILFNDRLSQTIGFSDANKTGFALLFLDLDHFKKINDLYGHHYGDIFLKQVAERLRSCVKSIDTVSRQGGDEFVLLLNEITAREDSAMAARQICDTLSRVFVVEGVHINASVSIGIALYPTDARTGDELLRNADLAMYHAKSKGRNQYQFFTEELNSQSNQRLEIENALRDALKRNEFRVYYQPQLNLQTGYVEACEALIRWQHPERGLLAPAEFIPIAEESGHIYSVGEWILREVVEHLSIFNNSGFRDLRVSVNVSALQLLEPKFATTVENILRSKEVPRGRIELEVTESMIMGDTTLAASTIKHLSTMGVLFAIDDFGTGYSSLSYLRRLKIHKLKIDRSFVTDLLQNDDEAAIVRTIIDLAKNLRLKTIAEGVETSEQQDFLRMHGCDLAQGFLIARPMALEDTLQFLGHANKY